MDLEQAYDKIYSYAYFKVHDRHLAEDITQETFLRYLNHSGKRGYEIRYLYTIARNLCIDEYRKTSWEPITERLENSLGDDPTESVLTGLSVNDALAKMKEQDREILLLRYVNEESVGTISRICQCSRFAVYRRIKKAREEFERLLGGDHT